MSLCRSLRHVRSTLLNCTRRCSNISNVPSYTPDPLDKKILVHFKYYATIEEVPNKVDQHIMSRVRLQDHRVGLTINNCFSFQAKSQARIKMANLMIFLTLLGSLLTVIYAKSNSRQNSLQEENYRRHLHYLKGETGSGTGRLGLVTHTKED